MFFLCTGLFFCFHCELTVQAQEHITNTATITPRSDIIGWRYKTVNGQVYRRQYNYTKSTWIGDWEKM